MRTTTVAENRSALVSPARSEGDTQEPESEQRKCRGDGGGRQGHIGSVLVRDSQRVAVAGKQDSRQRSFMPSAVVGIRTWGDHSTRDRQIAGIREFHTAGDSGAQHAIGCPMENVSTCRLVHDVDRPAYAGIRRLKRRVAERNQMHDRIEIDPHCLAAGKVEHKVCDQTQVGRRVRYARRDELRKGICPGIRSGRDTEP